MAPKKGKAPAKTEAGDVLATVGLGSVTLSLDPKAYPLSVVHGAAYVFLARAYVRVDRAKGRTVVRLSGKQRLDAAALEALAGEFANELTNQFVREDVAAKTTTLREQVVGRALLGALGTGDELSGLGAGDWGSGPESTPAAGETDDPLGIAQDWEVKFGHPADPPHRRSKGDESPPREKLHASDPGAAAAAQELAAREGK